MKVIIYLHMIVLFDKTYKEDYKGKGDYIEES